MIYLYIYIGAIGLLVIGYLMLHNHEQKLSRRIQQWIDKILSTFDRTIYFRKNAFVDFGSAKSLLFHNQEQFFSNPTEYTFLLPLLLKDVAYLSSLLSQEIISPKNLKDIQETQEVWEKLHTIKDYTHTILIFLTLGIGKLFLPK